MEDNKPNPESSRVLLWSCGVSALLLALFLYLQATESAWMELKAQWLWVAALPVVIGLVIGKYVGKFKVGEVEVGFRMDPEMLRLASAPGQTPPESSGIGPSKKETSAVLSPLSWTREREEEYSRTHRLFLVHVYEPSTSPGQKYDITIFLLRSVSPLNQREGFSEVEKLELYFGPYWNDAIFTSANNGGLIGVRTSSWASFLATGRVTFNDGSDPLILHRYVDFEMAHNKT
jgi:hypothetical protein